MAETWRSGTGVRTSIMPLEGQANIEESHQALSAGVVLSMFEEIFLAAVVGGIPFYHIKVRRKCCVSRLA